ncbi:MAG: hypothetical protein M1831_005624 [Alyxoria varia]|nr:MAG: hypothetical protein M1831_005624 [Alyxoria varia]
MFKVTQEESAQRDRLARKYRISFEKPCGRGSRNDSGQFLEDVAPQEELTQDFQHLLMKLVANESTSEIQTDKTPSIVIDLTNEDEEPQADSARPSASASSTPRKRRKSSSASEEGGDPPRRRKRRGSRRDRSP